MTRQLWTRGNFDQDSDQYHRHHRTTRLGRFCQHATPIRDEGNIASVGVHAGRGTGCAFAADTALATEVQESSSAVVG